MKQLVNMGIIFAGLAWFWLLANNPPWYMLFIILIAGVLIPELLFPPKKKQKSNKGKKSKKSSNPQSKTSNRKRSNVEVLLSNIDELNGEEFERLVAMYYEDKGYKPQIVGGSGDHEVDIILTDPKENYKIAVQCKHWKTKNVGNNTILRLSAGKRVHNCLDAWCITTSNYTKEAIAAAEGLNIRLLNGLHVQDQIGRWKKQKMNTK